MSRSAFLLTEQQQKKIDTWIDEHDKTHVRPGQKSRYTGAIGGAYTYMFTPTSIGDVVKVECACGETLDASFYEDW